MSKLRKSAKGRGCQVRIPGICNFNPETTVLAHLSGAGMGLKKNDIHGAFACSSCHDLIDARVNSEHYDSNEIKLMHYEGVERTQAIWINEGFIKVN